MTKENLVHYRYLFWACMRGHIFVVDHILYNFGISPFLAEKEEEKSPFMLAIENNQEKVVKLILIKEFRYGPNQKMADNMKQNTDKFNNNPLHKACRFRNPKLIKLLLDQKIGAID